MAKGTPPQHCAPSNTSGRTPYRLDRLRLDSETT